MSQDGASQQRAGQNEPASSTAQDSMPESPTLVRPPEDLWSGEQPVGSITSPSETGRYKMVLRDYAATVQIEGGLVALDFDELNSDGTPVSKTVLCQVSRMKSQNIHHENRLLGALLRERGRIPGLSGFADHKELELIPMDSVVSGGDVHQLPRNIPPMGTNVRFASIDDVRRFSGQHAALFNIGYLYETRVPIGLLLKHFGPGSDGWGDAHMLGVFGVSGSGKTVMAASIVAGFAARKEMGMLIVDPQGQFSGFELGKDKDNWSWRLDEAFRLVGRGPDVRVVKIDEIALESPGLFAELLERFDFLDALSIMGAEKKAQTVAELTTYLSEWLRTNKGETLGEMAWDSQIAADVCRMGASMYADPQKQAKKMREAFAATPYKVARAGAIWEDVRAMFARPYKLSDLLDDVLVNRKIVILDIDAEEGIKDIYCSEILSGINKKAEAIYRIQQDRPWRGDPAGKYKNVRTNALIVIDEAHRFAPQGGGANRDQDRMIATLTDAIRTTRKLGVGWCYITQSIASFNKEVFRQIQTRVLGVGIGTGADNDHLETAFNNNKDLIERYRNLPRPITTGTFPFAVIGELVALGNGSQALFVSAPSTQKDLFQLNPNHFKYPDGAPIPNSPGARSSGRPRELAPVLRSLPAPQGDASEDDIPF